MPPKAKASGPAKKGKAPKSHKLPDPLPLGEELQDMIKGRWRVGKPIGQGGFGLLYLASPTSENATSDPQFVVKVEPFANGPLFSELSFYQRVAKADSISQWASARRLKSLGMPRYVASGKHETGKEKYRFMIMERFAVDLQKKFEELGKKFNKKTVFTLAIQILDTLDYIHSKEYAHADIKASNLLMGYGKAKEHQAYLVDYGLAYRYTVDGKHKEYKEDPRRCHDGTIEFTSIDAHKGVCPSRRGDLEILGYCILQWFCSKLPWENKLSDSNYVRDQKEKFMNNIPSLMKACSCGDAAPEVQKYLEYVRKLKYEDQPDYALCKKIFTDGLKKSGLKDDGKLDFNTKAKKTPIKPASKAKGRKKAQAVEESMHNISQTSFDLGSSEEEQSPPKRGRRNVKSPSPAKRGTPASRAKSPVAAKQVRSPPQNRGVKRVQSPTSTGESPARSRVKTSAATAKKTASTRNAPAAVKKRPGRPKVSIGVQTSPGLKGLKRSREKKR